jgi:hypothetical protein
LQRTNWTVEFSWIKAHIGIYRNELADQLGKAAASNRHYDLLQQDSKEYVVQRNRRSYTKMAKRKEWENCTKAAITQQFFPNVRDRVKLNVSVNLNFTAMVTGHGKTRAYLHRFKIIENATCPCDKGDQTIDHLLKSAQYFKHKENVSGIMS